MTTYPLPTLGCTVGPTGISGPSYADIYASLQASLQGIYGSDTYLDPDSQDGQQLAIYARAQYDSNQATIAAYNNYSPATAQGTGLSTMVKINGLQREVSTFSTADITVVGVAGTIIVAGLVGDNQNLGTQWALPTGLVIPIGGSIVATATCTTPGAVAAAPATLVVILNPTAGWQTVNNVSNASIGQPVEDDATLRIRQSNSTSLPATSPLASIAAALSNLPGVTRLAPYENDTGAPDGNGIPAKSICLVVEGGVAADIAKTIELKKTLGCGTYGTTPEVVLDPGGLAITINFDVLGYTQIWVEVVLNPLTGYTSTIGMIVVQSIVNAINALAIGGTVYWNKLWAPANLSGNPALAAASSTLGVPQTQAQLDAMSATYDITSLLIGTPNFAAQSATLNTAGGGYAPGDTWTAAGGTGTKTIITIDSVGGGGSIATFHISTAGAYSVKPANPVAQFSSTGGGTLGTFNLEFLKTTDIVIAFNNVAQTETAQVSLVA